jgi:hypothetical protein
MIRTLGAFLIVAGLGCVPGAKAAGTNVKCAMNEDRVWVYESVVDFNLAAKLKCGEPVEIIGRVKGYVRVQTQAGVEGYVADSSFPKSALPPEPVEKPNDVGSASVAALAHHSAPASVTTTTPPPAATVASTAPAGSNASSPASSVAAKSASAKTANANVSAGPAPVVSRPQPPAVTPTPASQPALVANASRTAAPAAPEVSPSPVAAKPQPPTVAPAAKVQPAMIASAAPASAPAIPASQPAEVEITLSTAPTVSGPAPTSVSAHAVASSTPSARIAQPPSTPAPASYVSNASPNAAPADRAGVAPSPAIQPVSDSVVRPASRATNPDEDEDTSVRVLENENAGCAHFFSAYGLSPNQYKWLAQNRKKAFPSVCPAPTPAMVDFVVIFTHDVAFYNATMPAAVHVDHNGFSDWTPMSTVDTAFMTQSEANSSHHEYVWVFQTNRGAFDPAKFSSRRKPLFSKGETNMLGSHGGYKTVMDALTYIESNGTNR